MNVAIPVLMFYFFACIMCIGCIAMLFSKNVVYSAFAFLGVLLSIAALFVLGNAEFAAVAQVLIYVGGVLVLLLFGVMLTSGYTVLAQKKSVTISLLIGVICLALFTALVYTLGNGNWYTFTGLQSQDISEFSLSQKIGFLLMTLYVLPFEASGVLLLAALIGAAVVVGRK